MKLQEKKSFDTDFDKARSRMDRIFGDMVVSGRWAGFRHCRVWHPPTDVYETDEHYVVRVEVAGMREGDFSISLANNMLVISGLRGDPAIKRAYHQIEIGYGEFYSEVVLPGPVNDRDVEAIYEDGFLRVKLTKSPLRKVPVTEMRE